MLTRKIDIVAFYNSYLATYLERDVRSLAQHCRSAGFRAASCAPCALRSANLLNRVDLARDVGIAIPGCPRCKPPVRSRGWSHGSPAAPSPSSNGPKLYLADAGLRCALLNIRSEEVLRQTPSARAIWETWLCRQTTGAFEASWAHVPAASDGVKLDFARKGG
jgi:hypothetical protein